MPVCLPPVFACQLVGADDASLLHILQHGMHKYIETLHLVQQYGVQASGVLAFPWHGAFRVDPRSGTDLYRGQTNKPTNKQRIGAL